MSSSEEEQLGRLCEVLNEHHVAYVIFGSFARGASKAQISTQWTWTSFPTVR